MATNQHYMNYEVREGTRNQGTEFEMNLISLFALRGLSSDVEDAFIASNAACGEDFDDIILYLKYKKPAKENVFFLQLKHGDTQKVIRRRELLEGDKYNVRKYWKSYNAILETTGKTNRDPFIERKVRNLRRDGLWFVLFTNNSLDEDFKALQGSKNKFQVIDTGGKVHQFNFDAINEELKLKSMSKKQSNPELVQVNEEFVETFLIYSQQASNKELSNLMENELNKGMLAKLKLSHKIINDVVTNLIEYVNDWARGKLGEHFWLTKRHVSIKLTELLLRGFVSKFYKDGYSAMENCNFGLWHEIVQAKKATVLDSVTKANMEFLYGYYLHKLKNYILDSASLNQWETKFSKKSKLKFFKANEDDAFKKTLASLGKNEVVSVLNVYKALWQLERLPLLLEVNLSKDLEMALKVIESFDIDELHFIIIATNCETNSVSPNVLTRLSQMEHTIYSAIIGKIVSLQGRQITLERLLESHPSLTDPITPKYVMDTLIGPQEFLIGNTFEPLPYYYIDRKIPRVFLDVKKLKIDETSSDLFVIRYRNADDVETLLEWEHLNKLKRFVCNLKSLRGINDLPKNCKVLLTAWSSNDQQIMGCNKGQRNVHFLSLCNCRRKIEWIRSTGNIALIRQVIHGSDSEQCECKALNVAEATVHFSNQVNVISANPGMGKTTVLNYMAHHAPKNLWVLYLDLNGHMEHFCGSNFTKLLSSPLDHLKHFNEEILRRQNKVNKLNCDIFEKYLLSKSVLVLADGYDEIAPNGKEAVNVMLKSFSEVAQTKVWLTTRTLYGAHLEAVFNTISLQLDPFHPMDQVVFLQLYFTRELGYEEHDPGVICGFAYELLSYTRWKLSDWDVNFTGIPLQTMLIATVFSSHCATYVQTQKFTADYNFDLLDLYEKFVGLKEGIARRKYGQHFSAETYRDYQTLYALKVIFAEEDLRSFRVNEKVELISEIMKRTVEESQRDGIMVTDNELQLNFVHRTFSEFFAGKWLADNYTNDNAKLLITKLLNREYQVTRAVFDRILAKNCPLHKHIINLNLEEAQNLIETKPDLLREKDAGGRLPCHLAGAWGRRHFMPGKADVINFDDCKMEGEYSVSVRDEYCYNSNDAILRILKATLQSLVNLPADDVLKFTPLDYAMYTNSLANVNLMIAMNSFYVNVETYELNMQALLYHTIRYNYISLVSSISQEYVDNYELWSFTEKNNDTLLHLAAKCKRASVCQMLISKGIDVNVKNKNLQTPLHAAIAIIQKVENEYLPDWNEPTQSEESVVAVVRALLCNGIDVNCRDNKYQTALYYAIANNYENVTSLLIGAGADVKATYSAGGGLFHITPHACCTILHIAAGNDETGNLVRLLLRNCEVDVNATTSQGSTPLHYAATNGSNGNCDIARMLLDRGANVNELDVELENALSYAVQRNDVKLVRLLLDNGADTNLLLANDASCLHYAARNSTTCEIAELLIRAKSDVNVKSASGDTPLHVAVCNESKYGHKIVSLLLSSGVCNVNDANGTGETALLLAAQYGDRKSVQLLIENGADMALTAKSGLSVAHAAAANARTDRVVKMLAKVGLGAVNAKTDQGETPLHFAARNSKRSCNIARVLLAEGCDVNNVNDENETALYIAIGHAKLVKLLMANGADINLASKSSYLPIHLAAYASGTMKLLIEAGADVNAKSCLEETPLHLAARSPHKCSYDAARLLLSHGCDVNAPNYDCESALALAAQESDAKFVKLLIANGADVNSTTLSGFSVIHAAAKNHRTSEIVELLIKAGCDVNAKTLDGRTALHKAVTNRSGKCGYAIVRTLLSHGCNVDAVEETGTSALLLAVQYSHPTFARLLLEEGANVNLKNSRGFTALDMAITSSYELQIRPLLISYGAEESEWSSDEAGPSRRSLLTEMDDWKTWQIVYDDATLDEVCEPLKNAESMTNFDCDTANE